MKKSISLIALLAALVACSSSHFKPEQNKVTVSYKPPQGKCENLGSDTVETNHWASNETEILSEDVISDLVQSTCAKKANYIHIGRVEDNWHKRGLSSDIKKDGPNKEMKKTKVEGTFYNCSVVN
jgi:hypothetical protein